MLWMSCELNPCLIGLVSNLEDLGLDLVTNSVLFKLWALNLMETANTLGHLDVHAGVLDALDLTHEFYSLLELKGRLSTLLLNNLWGWNKLIEARVSDHFDVNLLTDLWLIQLVVLVKVLHDTDAKLSAVIFH
jgi:hypothetical protein